MTIHDVDGERRRVPSVAVTVPRATAGYGFDADRKGGFFCPVRGSEPDLAGRLYPGAPAPTDPVGPPHRWLADGLLRIGVGRDTEGAA